MPQRLEQVKQFILSNTPPSNEREQMLAYLNEASDELELLDFKVQKYVSEKEVVIRMLEKTVSEIEEQKTELAEINRLLLQKKTEIENQNKQLEKAMLMAKEGLQAKSDFLSTMSHEIRSPLNAIIGITYILLQDNPKPEQVKNLDVLKFSAENLLILINDILDFSKIEAGKVELENKEFDLQLFLHQLIEMFNVKAQEKNIKLKIVLDSRLPQFIKGDVNRLNQVLTNLISNAIKFTSHGGVTLEVNVVEEEAETSRIQFCVQDTGIGIPKAQQEKVFESFSQASTMTARKYGGTGLGLSISKKLVELMGGNIHLQSEEGKGSEFSFALNFHIPKEVTKINASYRVSANETGLLKNHSVLLVEDNEFNILVAKTYLENWGLLVDVAKDGIPGVERCNEKRYDLILLDLQMPEMNGIEAASLIRQNSLNTDTAIIALSATVTNTIRDEVKAAGMDDYLSKPFNPTDLYDKLCMHLLKKDKLRATA